MAKGVKLCGRCKLRPKTNVRGAPRCDECRVHGRRLHSTHKTSVEQRAIRAQRALDQADAVARFICAGGGSEYQIAAMLDLTRTRVSQIVADGFDRFERHWRIMYPDLPCPRFEHNEKT